MNINLETKQLHFSFDDTFRVFIFLTHHESEVESIFECNILKFMKKLHDTYNAKVTFYCMYTNEIMNLSDMTDKYQQQFIDNSNWMKFNFHCFSSDSNYSDIEKDQFEQDYQKVHDELVRIVGRESLSNTVRLHYFAGNRTAINILQQEGYNVFFCADDNRGSYYLTKDEERFMKQSNRWEDTENACNFLPTHIRLENITAIQNLKEKLDEFSLKHLVIFTHECQIDKTEIQEMIQMMYAWASEHGYTSVC